MSADRRRGAAPDPAALTALSGGLRKAPDVDPVLGAASGSPQERAAPLVTEVAPPAPVRKEKVNYYEDPVELARARAAYLHTHVDEGHRSWSEFVAAAVRREVDRLEGERNGGRPWPAVGAGELPTGRPFRG